MQDDDEELVDDGDELDTEFGDKILLLLMVCLTDDIFKNSFTNSSTFGDDEDDDVDEPEDNDEEFANDNGKDCTVQLPILPVLFVNE